MFVGNFVLLKRVTRKHLRTTADCCTGVDNCIFPPISINHRALALEAVCLQSVRGLHSPVVNEGLPPPRTVCNCYL